VTTSPDERKQLREGVLELGDEIPSYKSVTPEERRRIKKLLAVRLSKPLNEIGKGRLERGTVVEVSLDDLHYPRRWAPPNRGWTATTDWVDIDNAVLRIPKDESSKNRENWTVALGEQTADVLDRWLTERQTYTGTMDGTNSG